MARLFFIFQQFFHKKGIVVVRSTPGSMLVIGLLILGLLAAGVGVWFQWQQTRRCLAFYGTRATEQISKSPFVELWQLKPLSGGRHTGRLEAIRVEDITEAKGLVHLRRGLVEDANFKDVIGLSKTKGFDKVIGKCRNCGM